MTIPLWLLAALAAAAYLAVRRPAPAAALPPLSPLPMPTLSPVAPAAGPSPWQWVTLTMNVATIGICVLALSQFANREKPDVPPAPAVGLDLRGRFVGETAAIDAAITAELMDGLAAAVEHDPFADLDNDGKPDGARLNTGTKIAEARMIARDYRTQGVKIGDRQPLARDAIKAYLDAEVGTDGGPVDAAARAKWVAAFRSVAAAARAAVGR
jgi:hypothetical protein